MLLHEVRILRVALSSVNEGLVHIPGAPWPAPAGDEATLPPGPTLPLPLLALEPAPEYPGGRELDPPLADEPV